MIEKNASNITIPFVDPVSLKICIQYYQNGYIKINLNNLSGIIFAADYLQMPIILNECGKFISKKLNKYNWFKIMKIINKFSNQFKLIFQNFVRNNFRNIASSKDFLSLTPEELNYIVSDDYLFVDEFLIYDAINQWLNHESNRIQYYSILNNVRVSFIHKTYLFQYIILPLSRKGNLTLFFL